MVISSLVVETIPRQTTHVSDELAQLEGVEVHEVNECTIVVTIEAETIEASHATASDFIAIEGVRGINLVYANFEDDPTITKASLR